ncbi:MAG: hypothetical protein J6V09_00045 [Clostridia bacterium]|nr:hypothetical protein [Clostridia bacterium]
MLFKKSERKKHGIGAILAVGALAAVGAVSITKCGKRMIGDAVCKVKSFFQKKECPCEDGQDS